METVSGSSGSLPTGIGARKDVAAPSSTRCGRRGPRSHGRRLGHESARPGADSGPGPRRHGRRGQEAARAAVEPHEPVGAEEGPPGCERLDGGAQALEPGEQELGGVGDRSGVGSDKPQARAAGDSLGDAHARAHAEGGGRRIGLAEERRPARLGPERHRLVGERAPQTGPHPQREAGDECADDQEAAAWHPAIQHTERTFDRQAMLPRMPKRLNIQAVDVAYDDADPEGFNSGGARLGPLLGATRTGASVYEVPPGQSLLPYHYEYGEEEWLLRDHGPADAAPSGGHRPARGMGRRLLPGRPRGRARGQERHRPDGARAHVLEPKRAVPRAVYPDSGKVGIWTGNTDDDLIVERSSGVGYWHGEAPEAVAPSGGRVRVDGPQVEPPPLERRQPLLGGAPELALVRAPVACGHRLGVAVAQVEQLVLGLLDEIHVVAVGLLGVARSRPVVGPLGLADPREQIGALGLEELELAADDVGEARAARDPHAGMVSTAPGASFRTLR